MFQSILLIPLTLFSLSILCSFTLQSVFVHKKLINELWTISYLRNYYYLCCMNISNAPVMPNSPITTISSRLKSQGLMSVTCTEQVTKGLGAITVGVVCEIKIGE
jgi:hypothetical protein